MRAALSRVATRIVVGLLVVACASSPSPAPIATPPPVTTAAPVTSAPRPRTRRRHRCPGRRPAPDIAAAGRHRKHGDCGWLQPHLRDHGSVPVEISGVTSGVTAIAAGESHVCALTSGGGIRCWGSNADGKLGAGTTTEMLATTATDVSGLAGGVSAIAAGGRHTCALLIGGGVKCWGWNGYGQLGDGTTAMSGSPVDVSSLASGASAIAAGGAHSCALMSGGGVKCWGENISGQLGNGSTTSSSVPVDMDVAPPWAICEPPRPTLAFLPVCGTAREVRDRGILVAPGPGGSLYVAISAPWGPVTLALLDRAGIPKAGWPVVLADTTSCTFLLPVGDGSVRAVCTLENPGNLYDPMGAFALDAKGAMLAGWPADLGCCITDGRLVGDELMLLESWPTTDVEPVPSGQPVSIQQGLAVAADGSIRRGVQVPIIAGGPDGVADNIALDSGFDDGIESGPTFGPDGRIVITVGSYERSATRVLVFDADKKAVLARSAELPIASVEKPSDPEVCVVRTPNPPIVAADGTVFVFSELDTRVFALDPSLGGRTLSVPIGAACASSPHTGGRAAFMTSAFAGTSTARGSSPQLSWI